MTDKPRVKWMGGKFYWTMLMATGFADIPSSQGYRLITVGPYETLAAAVQAQTKQP